MKRLFIIVSFLLLFTQVSYGQTVVNLTVTDTPDNQLWNNGTWSVKLQPAAGNLSQTNSFTLLSGGGSLSSQSGSLSSTAAASITLPATANIAPTSAWQFTVCPQASAGCFQQAVTVSTSSPQTLAINPPSIRINLSTATPPISAYATGEITGAVIGSQFYLLGSGIQVCSVVSGNSCTTWVVSGSSPNSSTVSGIYAAAAPYNAKFDGRSSTDGVLNSTTTVTSATLSCTNADIGKLIFTVNGSFLARANSTVASCSGASFVMAAAATATESGDNFVVCSDDTTALASAFNAAIAASVPLYLPSGLSCVSGRPFFIPLVTYPPQQAGVVKGAGLNATYVGMVPSFNFAGLAAGAIYENDGLSCAYQGSAIKGFQLLTAEDWSVTGFQFGFPSWPAGGTFSALYNVCQVRRFGFFNVRSANAVGVILSQSEGTVADSQFQGFGSAVAVGNGTGISATGSQETLFNNVVAFGGTGIRLTTSQGSSIIGGLLTSNARNIDLKTNSIVEIADIDSDGGANIASNGGINVDATSTANMSRVLCINAGLANQTCVNNLGKVRMDMFDYIVNSGTPTEIINSGSFFDACGNNLTGAITNTGSWFGTCSITGTALVAGNLVPSANWGTSAAISAPIGDSQNFSFTLTNGTAAVGANPTIAFTFPTPFAGRAPVCTVTQVGGTQAILATTATLTPSAASVTTITLTYNGTPTINLTEFYQGQCQ